MRWMQLDPSGQDPGYVFAGDDPVNEEDPTGTDIFSTLSELSGCIKAAGSSKAINTYRVEFDSLEEEITPEALGYSCIAGAAAGSLNSNNHKRAGNGIENGNFLYDLFG